MPKRRFKRYATTSTLARNDQRTIRAPNQVKLRSQGRLHCKLQPLTYLCTMPAITIPLHMRLHQRREPAKQRIMCYANVVCSCVAQSHHLVAVNAAGYPEHANSLTVSECGRPPASTYT
jgi:hypothetical protein